MSDSAKENLRQMVEDFATRLIEHCDSVQIIATLHSENGDITAHVSSGHGNLYARHGAVKEWILMQDEYTKQKARNESDENNT